MAFDTYESSRQTGKPVTLYYFVYGENGDTPPVDSFYAYTDAAAPVTYDGVTYQPDVITHGNRAQTGNLDRTTLEVRTRKDLPVAELFQIYPPSQVVTLVIRQGHLGDTEFLVCWSGRVLAASRDDHEAVLGCEPISTSLRRTGLRRFYGYGCPHVLYSTACGASKAAATVTSTVAGISGFSLTLGGGWNGAFAYRDFRNGYVEWRSAEGIREIRSIQAVSDAGVIRVKGTITNLAVSDTVTVVAGCNHQMTDCADVHNNINNFGGQPWIPYSNPMRNVNYFG